MREAVVKTQQDYQRGMHIAKWFTSEEFYWRSIASVIWSMGFFQITIVVFIFISQIAIFSPVHSIFSSIQTMFSIYTMFSVICLQALCFLSSKLHGRNLAVTETVPRKTSRFLFYLLRPKQLSTTLANIVLCFIGGYILQNLGINNKRNSMQTFKIAAGVFIGLVYSIDYYKKNMNVVHFPIVNVLKYYYPFFIVVGYLPRAILYLFAYLHQESKLGEFLYNLCDLSLFWLLLCESTVLIFMMSISNQFLQIFNTQHYEFPVEVIRPEDSEKTLMHAMKSENLLLKHLSYYDYYLSSKFPSKRRLKMFELSSPGNQPNCWNSLCLETLRLLEVVSTNLRGEITRKEQAKVQQKITITQPSQQAQANTVGMQSLFSPGHPSTAMRQRTLSSTNEQHRNMQASQQNVGNTSPAAFPMDSVKCAVNLFGDFQILCWGIQGISNLVAASLTEDKYGVVQRKLSDILASLLDLLDICEKFTKVSLAPSSLSTYQQNAVEHESLMKNNQRCSSLKIVVKTALYNITTAFGYNISAVRLSNENMKRLNEFLLHND